MHTRIRRGAVIAALPLLFAAAVLAGERPRLAVLTDIGGDPDDQQSLIRLMVYANEFEIEALVATASGTPGELKEARTRPDLIREIVEAYGRVRPALERHAGDWPAVEAVLARISSGNPQRGRDHIGEGHDSDGSRRLIEGIDAGSPGRPLNITIWGGQTDFAQALWRVRRDRGPGGFGEFIRRFRVYDIDDQDRLADWMRSEFPGMFYILAKAPPGRDKREGAYRGMYLGGDEALTSRAWVDAHVRSKGPLGALYPVRTWTEPNPHGCLKEGDTPSWFFFLPAGGNTSGDPTQPGWGGQFQKEADGWFRDLPARPGFQPRDSVNRWRPAFQADFARRMAWCVAGSATAGGGRLILDANDHEVLEPSASGRWRLSGELGVRFVGRIEPHEGSVCSFFGPGVEAVEGRFAGVIVPAGWRRERHSNEQARTVTLARR